MRFATLGSGSAGNALLVESGDARILIDAGFSGRQLGLRAASLGVTLDQLDAVLVSHEHSDHVRGLKRLRALHPRVPVWLTRGTQDDDTVAEALTAGAADAVHTLISGRSIELADGRLQIEIFGVPHDAREPVGFVVTDAAGRRLGVVTDLGHRSRLAWARLRDVDALVLETNHDVHMLRTGPYPWHLKQRVAGRHGHLSNADAADGLEELAGDRLQAVMCYHLSRTNNCPARAVEALAERLDRCGSSARVVATAQDVPSDWIDVAPPGQVPGAQLALF
ncbi:MAG: MBL fold metallo-hydrolase [Acidobacteriota bacterium]